MSVDEGFSGKPAPCQAGAAGPGFPLGSCLITTGRIAELTGLARQRRGRQAGEEKLPQNATVWRAALAPQQLSHGGGDRE